MDRVSCLNTQVPEIAFHQFHVRPSVQNYRRLNYLGPVSTKRILMNAHYIFITLWVILLRCLNIEIRMQMLSPYFKRNLAYGAYLLCILSSISLTCIVYLKQHINWDLNLLFGVFHEKKCLEQEQ
jgi:hypothetical protein